jgi:hypothetical protein
MSSLRPWLLVVLLPVAAAATGCAVDATEDGDASQADDAVGATADELRASIAPGAFKLDAPGAVVSPACDQFTDMVLMQGVTAKAALSDNVKGTCKIAVIPNPRSYTLREVGTSCGSKIYRGQFTRAGKTSTIEITDHRARLCRDLQPALLIVKEKLAGKPATTRYTRREVANPVVTLEGTLASVVAIGGETTGTVITTPTSSRELQLGDFPFEDGKFARVRGTERTFNGVEIRQRTVLDVSEILICPDAGTTLNCMPGPNVRLSSVCANGNLSWILNNCKGVTATF